MGSAVDHFMAQQGFPEREPSSRRRHFQALRLRSSILALPVATLSPINEALSRRGHEAGRSEKVFTSTKLILHFSR